MSWDTASRDTIRKFYRDEFPTFRDALPNYIHHEKPVEYGMAFNSEYPVVGDDIPSRDFIRRKTWVTDADGHPVRPHFSSFDELLSFIQHPARYDPLGDTNANTRLADPDLDVTPPEPAQAALYYSTKSHDGPWQLFIDIDAKDVAEQRARQAVSREDIPGDRPSADDFRRIAGIVDADPTGYHYEFTDIEKALSYGFEVKGILKTQFNFDTVEVRYSGQGCHVIGLDSDRSHQYDTKSRLVLARLLEEEFDIPIDAAVTPDHARLTRVPYSLHTEVSRVVMPIDSPEFDFREEAIPSVADTTHRGNTATTEAKQAGADVADDDVDAVTMPPADKDATTADEGANGRETALSEASPEEIRAALSGDDGGSQQSTGPDEDSTD